MEESNGLKTPPGWRDTTDVPHSLSSPGFASYETMPQSGCVARSRPRQANGGGVARPRYPGALARCVYPAPQ